MTADALEVLLRACAAAWAIAAALVLMLRTPRTAATALAAFCACGVVAFLAVSWPPAFMALGPAAFVLDIACLASPLAFWMLARTLFEDAFVPSRVLLVGAAAIALVEGAADSGRFTLGWLGAAPAAANVLFLALRAFSFALVAHGIAIALLGWRGDLVDARRSVRLAFALLAGGAFAVTVASSFVFAQGAPQSARLSGIALLALAMLALLVLVATGVVHARLREVLPPVRRSANPPRVLERADDALAQRVVDAMERGEAWREERLTLPALAQRLEVPEYRLRRAINHHLGHRSFSAFVAHYRLAASAARLADPAHAGVPVMAVALDCGFNSIGPFNRAFRARFGMTPTEFRAAARSRTLADSSNRAAVEAFGETASGR